MKYIILLGLLLLSGCYVVEEAPLEFKNSFQSCMDYCYDYGIEAEAYQVEECYFDTIKGCRKYYDNNWSQVHQDNAYGLCKDYAWEDCERNIGDIAEKYCFEQCAGGDND